MSYESACGALSSEKIDFPKDDPFNKTESMQISRTDMNMLIMNYLVTGTSFTVSLFRNVWREFFINGDLYVCLTDCRGI